MTAWMEPFAFWLADFYLAATLLLIAAAAIFALVKQPSRRMAVAWGIVPGLLLAAGFCLSASRPHVRLTSRRLYAGGLRAPIDAQLKTAGIKPAARGNDSTIVNETEPVPIDESDRLQSERFEPESIAVEPAATTVSLPEVAAISEPGRPAWASRLVAVFVWAFLAGSLLVASRLALGVWRASRLVRDSEPAPPGCVDELHGLIGTAAREPRLRVNRRLLTPVATGTIRPAILLPTESSRGDEPRVLRAVLAHEWTHIKNGDLWLLALDRIVLSLLWAHPLYWWTRRRIRADQEFLADAAAAAQIGSADYAALLVHWARKVTEQRSLAALTAVGIWERPAGLTERVTALLAGSESAQVRISGRTRVGIAAALALLSLAAATISLRPPQTALAQAERARAEDKPDAVSGSTVASPAPSLPIVQLTPANESPRSEPAQNTSDSNDVQGTCGDKQGNPLAGVQISLYAIQKASGRAQLVRQGTTDAEGRFRFPDCLGKKAVQLSWQLHDEDGADFEVFARRADLGTGVKTVNERGQYLDFTLTKAAPLTGTVRDRQGRPIAGALIRNMYWILPKTGWLSAKSDAKGYFTIADLTEYKYAGPKGSGPPLGLLSVEHPEYGAAEASYKRVPGYLEVVLGKAATIQGTVVSGETGKPAVGVSVFANWIDQPIPAVAVDLPHAQTDKNGRYQLRPLPEGLFNLEVSAEPIKGIMSFERRDTKLVAAPIEQFRTKEGQTATAPPIRLVKGGVVKGSLYQYRPGVNGVRDPVKFKEDEKLEIIVFYGPTLPGPGVVGDMTFVRPDGTFELRLPPGLHYLALPSSQKPDGTHRLPYSDMGEPCTEEDAAPPQLNNLHRIKIREGQTTEIEISVFRPDAVQKMAGEKQTRHAKSTSPQLAAADGSQVPKITDYHVAKDEIGGMCLSRGEARLSGVEVSLYLESFPGRGARQHDLLGRTATNEQGQFLFQQVRHLDSVEAKNGARYVIVARRKELATEVQELNHSHDWVDLKLADAVAVRGTVKDEQGQPVAGALVRCNGNAWRSLADAVHSARTDALGQFQIDDVATLWGCVIEHPDYPAKALYDESTFQPREASHFSSDVLQRPLNVTLVKGSVVEGQVIDSLTRRPGVGVKVTIQASPTRPPYIGHRITFAEDPCLFSAETQTDGSGHYRFTRVPAGRFAVYLTSDVPARASIALPSLEVPAAMTVHAADIRLVKGGIVHGSLIDDQSGQPARLGEDEQVTITVDGPARPRQRGIQAYLQPQSFPVAEDGTFQLRLPPGKNLVRVSGRPYFAEQPADRNANQDIRELEIQDGQEATLEFRVVRIVPLKRQSAGATSKASSSADTGEAKPEWFHVRGGDIGGFWSDAGGHAIAGAKVTLLSTDTDGAQRRVLKATTTNSWGQFLFVCASCLSGPNQQYELVLSRDHAPPEVRKMVHPGEWLELRASPIEFRGIRQVPMKKAPEKPIKNSLAPTSGAVNRPAPVAVEGE